MTGGGDRQNIKGELFASGNVDELVPEDTLLDNDVHKLSDNKDEPRLA